MPKSRNRGKKYNPTSHTNRKMSQPSENRSATKTGNAITHQSFRGQVFQSNYPPPEMMAAYAEVDPNFPDRLLSMAENEGKHRKFREKLIIIGSLILDFLGLVFGLAAAGGILYTGWLFMKSNYATEGAWIIGAVTATIAIAFISRGKRGGNSTTK